MNHRNTAIKRILADVKELQRHPSSRYYAVPLEDNMFEWHFTIRGPDDTPFAGGTYHGRILLPADYPFKPPNIVFLTKNGRFEVGTKICLSISAYHEETWQPAWGVRTMLEAIISFMPTEGAGAIGALDWSAEERIKLAKESNAYCCPLCGPIAQLLTAPGEGEKVDEQMQEQIAQLHLGGAHKQSEKISLRALANDMAMGVEGDSVGEMAGGIEEMGDRHTCDVDDFVGGGEGVGMVGGRDLGLDLPPFLEEQKGVLEENIVAQALDRLDNAVDAEDNMDHMMNIEDHIDTPHSTRAAKYTNHNMRSTSNSKVTTPVSPPPTPVPAPAAPMPAPQLRQRHAPPPAPAPPAPAPIPQAVVVQVRPEWRRRLDKLLDLLILIVSAGILSLTYKMLLSYGK